MKAYYEKRSYRKNIIPLSIYKHDHRSFNFYAHWHSDIELIFVLEGTLHIGINGDVKTLHKNEMAICCSGDIHFYNSVNMESNIYIVVFKPILIDCHGNWPESIRFKSSFVTEGILEETGIDPIIFNRIRDIFDNIYDETTKQKPYYNFFVTSKITELCGICQRFIPSLPIESNLENKRISRLKTVQEILQYIESNYMNPLTLDETASYFNLSAFHFCRLFKSLTGTNFKHYLDTIRIKNAEEQIKSSNNSITNIAMECGFNNIRTFNRVFKAVKGYIPSSLR